MQWTIFVCSLLANVYDILPIILLVFENIHSRGQFVCTSGEFSFLPPRRQTTTILRLWLTMKSQAAAVTEPDVERKERVKLRWALLRQALLGSASSPPASSHDESIPTDATGVNGGAITGTEYSMNSFQGFGVLDRRILSDKEATAQLWYQKTFNGCTANTKNTDEWSIVHNSYTTNKGKNITFPTREVKQSQQSQSTIQDRVEALLSHRTHGVDNTGNVRVWDAEATLAGFLLSVVFNGTDTVGCNGNGVDNTNLSSLKDNLHSMLTNTGTNEKEETINNILELGAGQAGLAGLSLAAAFISDNDERDNRLEDRANMNPLHLVLTDGHPKCVSNNTVCADMMKQASNSLKIDTSLLLWDSSPSGAEACRQLNRLLTNNPVESVEDGQYQLCLASDCVHFQEFHDGLLLTIARALAVNGVALLCQPRRGTSLDNFRTLVNELNASGNGKPLFEVHLFDDFYPKVTEMHSSLMNTKQIQSTNTTPLQRYDPNWHRPLLLALKKVSLYDETFHGDIARRHLQLRMK